MDHIFGTKKDKLFCPAFVFHREISNAVCDLVLYLQNKDLFWYNSIPLLKNGIHNTVFIQVFKKLGVGFSADWDTKHPCKMELKCIISPKCFPFPFSSFSLVFEPEMTTNLLIMFPFKKIFRSENISHSSVSIINE